MTAVYAVYPSLERAVMVSQNVRYARIAGLLYFLTHITAVTAVAAYGSINSANGIYVGVLLEFLLALGCIGTGVMLLPLLRRHGETRALSFAFLRGLEGAVILAGTLPMMVIAAAERFGTDAFPLVELHDASFLMGQGLVISINTIILGSLLLSSGLVPRSLALLGLGGGALVLTTNLAQLFEIIPQGGVIAGIGAVPIFTFEIWFAITLVRGKRYEQAETPAEQVAQGCL